MIKLIQRVIGLLSHKLETKKINLKLTRGRRKDILMMMTMSRRRSKILENKSNKRLSNLDFKMMYSHSLSHPHRNIS